MSIYKSILYTSSLFLILMSCDRSNNKEENSETQNNFVVVQAEGFNLSSDSLKTKGESTVIIESDGWLAFDVNFENAGKYKTIVFASSDSDSAQLWVEDYIDNTDGRTYDVTGKIAVNSKQDLAEFHVDGSPFNVGLHKIKIHAVKGAVRLDKIEFQPIKNFISTPKSLTQNMDGKEWDLVWSDEFTSEIPDTTKWTYDIGNWGWGNNELEYYTKNKSENARIENGSLVIEARKNDTGNGWTSARLTTREKVSFLYGKIEFKAQVPRERGNWAAGWTLGDSYVDEKSWPYCGEIDILESVGYEVNDKTGDGIAHVTVHTPAYYFKINNQISNTKDIPNIAGTFHTYSVEWTPTEIKGFVDGKQYYVYDKIANEKEWPFNKPQNIILNLAMGGGWGGAKGLDPTIKSQKFIIDYVRVYGKK